MRRLGSVLDPEELDNLYAAKAIVYVEGESDEAFFAALAGPDIAENLEFKVPPTGGGYFQVRDRVCEERDRGNNRIYGLLDGEAAAAFAIIERLIDSRGVLFDTGNVAVDGLLFLSEAELENLVLCHAGVAEFLTHNVGFAGIGKANIQSFADELKGLAQRFYVLAILRFVAVEFHNAGTPCKPVDKLSGRFQSKDAVLVILAHIKADLIADGVPWPAFLARVLTLMRRVRSAFVDDGTHPSPKERHVLRLADGKGLLKRVRSTYNGPPAWEGLLTERLRTAPYSAEFRSALLAATM